MRVNITSAKEFGVPKKNLVKDLTSIYVFCRQLNRDAQFLYTNNTSLFSYPYTDLWSCAYLRSALNSRAFDTLWTLAAPHSTPVYEVLLSYVSTMNTSLVDWPVRKLRKFVLYDCEFVISLAKYQAPLISSGTGKEPIPPIDHYDIIFGNG